jgi:hypothetical protein
MPFHPLVCLLLITSYTIQKTVFTNITMRFSVLTSLALASLAIAAPAPQDGEVKDIQFVLDGYKVIISNAKQLITKVEALKAGDDIVAKLKEMSTLSGKTIAVTEQLTKDINAKKGTLTPQAAYQVAKPSQDVAADTLRIIDVLVTKKDLFVKAKVHKIVLEDLNHLYKVSVDFVAAAKAKVPSNLQQYSNGPFDSLLASLAKGVQNFA